MFILRCNQIFLQNINEDLENNLIRRKQHVASLAKEIYLMLITPPFVVKKPTGIDFIQQQLQSQFRDHMKALRRSAANKAPKAAAAAAASGKVASTQQLQTLDEEDDEEREGANRRGLITNNNQSDDEEEDDDGEKDDDDGEWKSVEEGS